MNFKVVENHQPTYDIEEVKKDYTETDLSVKQIREKYGISQGQWLTILKHWKREGVTMRGYMVNHTQTLETRRSNHERIQ